MPIVAVESTLNWYWLVDGLHEAGLEVKLAHPLGLFTITGAKCQADLMLANSGSPIARRMA